MFELIKKLFFAGTTFLSSLTSVKPLNYFSVSNQECKIRPKVITISSDEPTFTALKIK